MRKNNRLYITLPIILLLLFHIDAAINGARDGIMLCIKTIIPSILPLMFLFNIIADNASSFSLVSLRKVSRSLKIPNSCESIFILSLISGYPVGATIISNMRTRGSLSRSAACRLMGICNNAGLPFIFGMSAALFSLPYVPWVVLLIQIAATCIVSLLLPEESSHQQGVPVPQTSRSIGTVLSVSLKSIAMICGWIIIFRSTTFCLETAFPMLFPQGKNVILHGILELSNGCINLKSVTSESLRFVLFNIFLSFGGLCVWMQIISTAQNVVSGWLFIGKSMHLLLVILLSLFAQYIVFHSHSDHISLLVPIGLLIPVSILLFTLHSKKTVALQRKLLYNDQ